MNVPEPAIISEKISQSSDTSLFRIRSEQQKRLSAADFQPGQFLQLSLPGIGEVPISYCGLPQPDGTIEMCVKNAGHVTAALHSASTGAPVAVHGPYGRGFPLGKMTGHDIVLIAGGVGIAPLRSLLSTILQSRRKYGTVTLLYGVRAPEMFLFRADLKAFSGRSDMCLFLGADQHGPWPADYPSYRLAMLPSLMEHVELDRHTIAALCGPPAAYPHILKELKKHAVTDQNIYLSLERRMKCGIGRCAHCAIGTLLCCVDGPVFSWSQLQGIEGAL